MNTDRLRAFARKEADISEVIYDALVQLATNKLVRTIQTVMTVYMAVRELGYSAEEPCPHMTALKAAAACGDLVVDAQPRVRLLSEPITRERWERYVNVSNENLKNP